MLSIKATFIIPSAVSITCSSQLPDVVFLLPKLRHQPFRPRNKVVRQRNFFSDICVKRKWRCHCKKMFESATQSTLLILRILIALKEMHQQFLLALQVVECQNITSEKKSNISQNFCSRKIKNLVFWCFLECAFLKHQCFINSSCCCSCTDFQP